MAKLLTKHFPMTSSSLLRPKTLILVLLAWLSTIPLHASQLTILLYHHINDSTPATTSTSPSLFQQHLQYLQQHHYSVVPLQQSLDALFRGETLADNSVAITFDDAYLSIYRNAFPLLKQHKMPFTVFVSTQSVDKAYPAMMSWEQLKEMQQQGATIANHTVSHQHLHTLTPEQHHQELLAAQKSVQHHMHIAAPLFAYPYGEFDQALMQYTAQQGWYGFAQISGPVSIYSNPQALPRFSVSGRYGEMSAFKLRVSARAMPIKTTNISPQKFDPSKTQVSLKFATLPFAEEKLSCFINNQRIEKIQWCRQEASIVLPSSLTTGYPHINCTAPYSKESYYWHTIPLFSRSKKP